MLEKLKAIWLCGSTTKKIYILSGSSAATAGLCMVAGFLKLCWSASPEAASIAACGGAVVALFTALFGFASSAQKHKASCDAKNQNDA